MKPTLQALLAAAGLVLATHAAAQITFYEREGFRGRAVSTEDRIWNFERIGFNDRASSVVVERGRWEVCEDARFEGRCVILRRGSYPSLREVGLNNAISSARRLERGREQAWDDAPPAVAVVPLYEPPRVVAVPPPPAPRPFARPAWYDVPVTSARAVVGPPSQRCWIEREQVAQPVAGQPNVGGAIVGGVVGGILGHQVGGGSGRDAATVGGAIAGAAIGANVNRGAGQVAYAERDVQRCQTVASTQPAYWDVTYWHAGLEHRVQMTSAPGPTIRVDASGAPLGTPR